MIFGNLKSWKNEKHIYPEAIQRAISFLEETDLENLQPGKYEIEGDNIFVNVLDKETESKEKRAPEAHKKYIDVQYLVSGKEIIGFAKISDGLVVKEDKLEEKDIVKYTNEVPNEVDLKLIPGDFGIFFPDDVHRPQCEFEGPQRVRKAIVKIALSALK